MKKLLLVLIASMLVTGLTACTPKEVASQGVTDDEVLIANCAATSGLYSAVGIPFVAGIEAYLKYVNDAGGVDGRTVKFLHQDDEFDPVKGKACLDSMINDEQVFAIVGHFGTPVVGATLQDLKDAGIPAVYFATGIGMLYDDKATVEEKNTNIFPVQPIYTTEGRIMVARAVGDYGAAKIGIIYTNDDAGKDMLKGAEVEAEAQGVELVKVQVTVGGADVSAAVTTIKEANVDFIIGASIQATIPTIIKELAAQGVDKDVITTYVNVSPAIASLFIDDIQGKFDVYGNGWVAFDAAHADALALYQANIDASYALNAYAITGWIAAYYFVEGLKRLEGKVVNWENYIEAMEEAPITNPFGGVIDYADGARMGTQEMNLSKAVLNPAWDGVDATKKGIWTAEKGLEGIDSILGN